MDPAGVSAFLDDVAARGLELHGLMVLRRGAVAAEGWWEPYGPDRVHLLYSLSKTFTSAALGHAVAEGLVDLDATVLSCFPELDDEVTDPRSRAIRVRDVAAMASGHETETVDRAWALSPEDLVRGFLLLPPEHDPGSHFAYNQPCTYALAAILQRASGTTLTEYLRPRVLEPLGITVGGWQQRPEGQDLGYSGLHLTTESAARLGLALLGDGVVQGRRVLPEGWVAEMSRVHVATAPVPDPEGAGEVAGAGEGWRGDWAQGYGFQVWRSRHGFRGDGAFGQFCLVLPELDAVVATNAATEDLQGILEAVWTHLLPALGDGDAGSEDPAGPTPAAAALAERLRGLALPVAATAAELQEGTWVGGAADAVGLGRLELRRAGDRWVVEVSLGGEALVVEAGVGRWAVTEPVGGRAAIAAAVGAPDADTVEVEVALVETPHRLTVRGRRSTGELTSTWRTRPLGGQPSLVSYQRPLTAG